jgi:transcriptional regulator with XRE-family HTH domain
MAGLVDPTDRGDSTPPEAPIGMRALGLYVRRSRLFIRFSQRTLSHRTGVSQSKVARLELGRAGGLRSEDLVAVAGGLGQAFPFGFCPHNHRCIWQPIRPPPPPDDRDALLERLVELGMDTPYPHGWGD